MSNQKVFLFPGYRRSRRRQAALIKRNDTSCSVLRTREEHKSDMRTALTSSHFIGG